MADKTKTRKPDERKTSEKSKDRDTMTRKPSGKKDDGVKRRPEPEEPRRLPGEEEEERWEVEDEDLEDDG